MRKFGNRLAVQYWLSLALVLVSITGLSADGSVSVPPDTGRTARQPIAHALSEDILYQGITELLLSRIAINSTVSTNYTVLVSLLTYHLHD